MIALGAHAPFLARPLGIRLPVYPLKGYSLTLPVSGASPRISVTDFKRKVVYAPLADPEGAKLRVAGMADIAGYGTHIDPVRIAQLIVEARAAFPAATDFNASPDRMQAWGGLRPATPKGTPLLGKDGCAELVCQLRSRRARLDPRAGKRARSRGYHRRPTTFDIA